MFKSFMSHVKDLVISILVLKAYFFFLILFPFSFILVKFIKKKNQKNLFVIFATNFSNEKKIKYKHNYNIINSIKEAGYDFKFHQFNENNKIYKKTFSNLIWFIEIIKLNPRYLYFYSDNQSKGNYPSIVVFYLISKIIKCKTICISHDYIWKINYKFKLQNKKFFDVILAQPYAYFKNKKILFTEPWLTSKKLHFNPSINRKYEITFIGRAIDSRLKMINKLKNEGIKINTYGPGFKKVLTNKEYIKMLQRSKITINFNNRQYDYNLKFLSQSKGRVLESISFGCLLFEEKNEFTEKIFKNKKHYVKFKNYQDLKNKLNFYLKNYDKLGIKIAQEGHDYLKKHYSPKLIWAKIFDNI